MTRLQGLSVFCFIAILGAALGYAFRRPATIAPKNEETVRLSIPPGALIIGTVWEDDRFDWTVPIENKEAVPVEVASFSRSCNCLSIEPEAFVLEPGERRNLHLQIDLLAKQTKPSGEVSISLYPHLKMMSEAELAKRRPPKWTLKGQIRRVLALDRSVYLGRYSELAQPLPAREIPIEVLVPLQSLSVECSLPSFTASVELPSSGQGKTVLRLVQSTSLPEGPIQGTVTLKPVRQKGKPLPVRRLEIAGKIVPDVEAVPPAVQVGGRRLGEMFEEVVVLRSMTGKTLGTVRAETNGEGLSVEADKQSGSYRVRQKVCGEGSQTNWIRFFTKPDKHTITIMVPISYTGIATQ